MASRPLRSDPVAVVALLSGPGRSDLAQFLIRQRWFAAKTRGVGTLTVEDWAALEAEAPLLLVLLVVDGDRYYVPLAVSAEAAPGAALAWLDGDAVVDAHDDPRFGRRFLAALAAGRTLPGCRGRFQLRPTPGWNFPSDPAAQPARRLSGEQSNTSVVLGESLVLKSLRRPQPGINPDLEMTRFLTTRTRFRQVPRLAGSLEYEDARGPATLAVLQEFVDNDGDGWHHVVTALRPRAGAIEPGPVPPGPDPLVEDVRRLGEITGGLHVALASDASDPDFRPEPITREDVERWARDIGRDLARGDVPRLLAERLGWRGDPRREGARILGALERLAGAVKIRCHGDYHLGQVLKTRDGFTIIDFEGEPARPLAERRMRQAALRDVAGMLRSLDYAAHAVAFERPEAERPRVLAALTAWEHRARAAFLDAYRGAAAASRLPLVPASEPTLLRACAAFELEKACYELRYEMNNRPDWLPIPLAGIARILSSL
jgi:trehalose synthase-fused probable maltokinase